MTDLQKKLFSEARRKETAAMSEAAEDVAEAFGNEATRRLASDIRGKVASYLVARSLREKYAQLYRDPDYGEALKQSIEEDVRSVIKDPTDY